MGVTLQDLHCIAVGDVFKAHPVGCKYLIPHFDAVLFCKPTWVQPKEETFIDIQAFTDEPTQEMFVAVQVKCVSITVMPSGVYKTRIIQFICFKRRPWRAKQALDKHTSALMSVFILRDINAKSKLFASSDVEAQTVVVRRGEEVDDPTECEVRAGL